MKPTIFLCLVFLLLPVGHCFGCFGPKLYIGADGSPRQQTLYALVSLYIKEKTGTESEQVESTVGGQLQLIVEDRADLVLVDGAVHKGRPVPFQVERLPQIVSGPRPVEELQFTLVVPALGKLSRLLTVAKFEPLVEKVSGGAPPAAVARAFLMEQGWI